MKSFGSDNHSGVDPQVFKFLQEANNLGHVDAYGDDSYTREVDQKISEYFDGLAGVYYCFNGTGANVISLRSVLKPYEAAIVTDCSHLVADECGAPETAGIKLLQVPHTNGKLRVQDLKKFQEIENDQHWVQPKLVSITQSTEFGTVYSEKEIAEISAFCKGAGWYLHMDGARVSNAAAALSLNLKQMTKDLGVDLLSLGGTKNGLMAAEAVLIFNQELKEGFKFYRKQRLQLSSKMRYLAAQFDAFFHNDLWLKNAKNANAMANYLADCCKKLMGQGALKGEVQANEVFVYFPSSSTIDSLQKKWSFHTWDVSTCLVRFVCSFDTAKEDVDMLMADLQKLL